MHDVTNDIPELQLILWMNFYNQNSSFIKKNLKSQNSYISLHYHNCFVLVFFLCDILRSIRVFNDINEYIISI